MESSSNPTDRQMLGLDTSVVLRLLIGEPVAQARVAKETIEKAAQNGRIAWVCDLVVCETYYALYAYYEVPKEEAIRSLLDIFNSGIVRNDGVAVHALQEAVASSKKLGVIDRMIYRHYEENLASLVTFEKAAARLPKAIHLKT